MGQEVLAVGGLSVPGKLDDISFSVRAGEIAGVFGFTYLFGAAYLGPRVGVALFASAVTAGTLVGSVWLDHVGAFGGGVYRVDGLRIAGLIALFAGVVLVRASR